MKEDRLRRLIAIFLVILHVERCVGQNPEIHQAAALSRFTGIYSFLGSYIAAREAYFLASLVCVLLAGNVFLTFFQLPSYFLPIYHNQKRSLESGGGAGLLRRIADFLSFCVQIITLIDAVTEGRWSL